MKLSVEIVALLTSLSIPSLAQEPSACPGIFAVTSGAVSGCCVGAPTPTTGHAELEARATRTRATLVQDAATTAATTTKRKTKTKTKTSSSTIGPLTCATWIPVTQANYTGLLQEASMSLNATGTNLRTTITPVTTGAAATSSSAADSAMEAVPLVGGVNVAAVVAAALAWLVR